MRPRQVQRGVLLASALLLTAGAQSQKVLGSGTKGYRNPVLYADYSDPDVIRDGKDFYLISSSFNRSPGLPILHSRDLVHWKLAGHVLPRLNFGPAYDMQGGLRYGRGVWAPAVRFHAGLFYVYFPTPDEGIFVSTAPHMTGPWSAPTTVIAGPGWEDPCPFWDDDGTAYLVHSKLHAGPLILHRMAPDGKSVLDEGKVIVQDAQNLPTLEGPKIYKRNGWYYLFAPAGGVAQGVQVVLRSRSLYGPYEHRTVLAQGHTDVNGPHQGGYVETPDGTGYFVHFSERGAHGRIVYLEPVRWQNDWPVMGDAAPGAETGQPVAGGSLPVVAPEASTWRIQTSDEFSGTTLSPMWEWNHNPEDAHWSLRARKGFLRLQPMPADDLLHARNTLLETTQDSALEFTARLDLAHLADGDRVGVSLFESSLTYVAVRQNNGQRTLVFSVKGTETSGPAMNGRFVQLRARLVGDVATYSYSLDEGQHFTQLGEPTKLTFNWWQGAHAAVFAFQSGSPGVDAGYVDVDWVHYRALAADDMAAARP